MKDGGFLARINGTEIHYLVWHGALRVCDCSQADQCEECGLPMDTDDVTLVKGQLRCGCGTTYPVRRVTSCRSAQAAR